MSEIRVSNTTSIRLTIFYVGRAPPLDAKGLLFVAVAPPWHHALVLDHGWLKESFRPVSTGNPIRTRACISTSMYRGWVDARMTDEDKEWNYAFSRQD